MASPTYPSTFPGVQRSGFSTSQNAGLTRVNFQSGWSRQRRAFTNLPTEVSLSFVVPYAEWHTWLDWINGNGYTWFRLELPSYEGSKAGGDLCGTEVEVRFITDLTWSIAGEDSVQVSVAAEFKR